jgi:RNA polymerase sigma-70 factor (ECF subfamily)
MDDSPVVALNRSVAISKVHSPKAAIEAVEAIKNREQLDSYYLLYAVLGEFEELLNNRKAAANYFRKSLELATIKSERKFLMKRLRAVEDSRSGN